MLNVAELNRVLLGYLLPIALVQDLHVDRQGGWPCFVLLRCVAPHGHAYERLFLFGPINFGGARMGCMRHWWFCVGMRVALDLLQPSPMDPPLPWLCLGLPVGEVLRSSTHPQHVCDLLTLPLSGYVCDRNLACEGKKKCQQQSAT